MSKCIYIKLGEDHYRLSLRNVVHLKNLYIKVQSDLNAENKGRAKWYLIEKLTRFIKSNGKRM